jgi:Family of unknown function (DUF5682)
MSAPPSAGGFGALRAQLLDAATALAGGPDELAGIMSGMVDDVDRALREELEIFPVCHHSPASGLAMVRRLREKQPKVIYLELCEDLQPLLEELRNCRLPVALQAFASELHGFPPEWGPLSVVAPITEASAEYQAVAYALDTPGVELVAVDRSADHVFQWLPASHPSPRRPRTTPPMARTPPCTATPSASSSATCDPAWPSSRPTCSTTARSGTGRSGGTSSWSSRWPPPTTTPTGR